MGNLHFTATIDAASFNKTLDDIEKRIKGIQEEGNPGKPFFNFTGLSGTDAMIQAFGNINSGTIQLRSEFRQLNDEIKFFDTTPVNEGLDDFKKRMEEVKEKAGSLTEYLQKLNEEKEKLGKVEEGNKKFEFLILQITETEKKRKTLLNDFLNEVYLQEEKRMGLQGKFSDMRIELDKQYADKKSAIYQNALAKISEQEKVELQKYDVAAVLKKSKGYQELQKILIGPEDAVLKSKIQHTKKVLEDLSRNGLQNTEEYKKQLQSLIDLQQKQLAGQVSYLSGIGKLFSGIKKEYGGIFKIVSNLGDTLTEAATTFEKMGKITSILDQRETSLKSAQQPIQVIKAIKDAQKAINKEVSSIVLQKAIEFINDLGAAIQQYNQKKKAYFESISAQQASYNKLLNDELRLKTESEGLFAADAGSKIIDAIEARTDAQQHFNEAMGELNDSGQAKNGITFGLDAIEGLKGLTSGVFGFFKGFKTIDKLTPILKKYPKLYDAATGGVEGFNKELAQTLISSDAVDEATKKQLQTTLDWVNQYDLAQKQLQESILTLTGQVGEDLKNALVSAFKEGQSAADALGKTVDKIIENIVTQTLYTEILKPAIDQLGNEIKASYGRDENGNKTGDDKITDDLQRFNETYGKEAAEEYIKELETQKKMFKDMGIDIFGQADTGGTTPGLSGAIKTITEESAGVLTGQMNAIRITQADNLDVNRNQLLALTKIASNSDYLSYLQSIDKKMDKLNNDDLRSGGLT